MFFTCFFFLDGSENYSSAFKRHEAWNPKNGSHRNVNILHKVWLETAENIGKDGKLTI
jgi:hypothetical protein